MTHNTSIITFHVKNHIIQDSRKITPKSIRNIFTYFIGDTPWPLVTERKKPFRDETQREKALKSESCHLIHLHGGAFSAS